MSSVNNNRKKGNKKQAVPMSKNAKIIIFTLVKEDI